MSFLSSRSFLLATGVVCLLSPMASHAQVQSTLPWEFSDITQFNGSHRQELAQKCSGFQQQELVDLAQVSVPKNVKTSGQRVTITHAFGSVSLELPQWNGVRVGGKIVRPYTKVSNTKFLFGRPEITMKVNQDASCELGRMYTLNVEKRTLREIEALSKEQVARLTREGASFDEMPVVKFTLNNKPAMLLPTIIENGPGTAQMVYQKLLVEYKPGITLHFQPSNEGAMNAVLPPELLWMASSIR